MRNKLGCFRPLSETQFVCLPISSIVYIYSCPQFVDIADECSLSTPAGQCCPQLTCDNSTDTNSTIGGSGDGGQLCTEINNVNCFNFGIEFRKCKCVFLGSSKLVNLDQSVN